MWKIKIWSLYTLWSISVVIDICCEILSGASTLGTHISEARIALKMMTLYTLINPLWPHGAYLSVHYWSRAWLTTFSTFSGWPIITFHRKTFNDNYLRFEVYSQGVVGIAIIRVCENVKNPIAKINNTQTNSCSKWSSPVCTEGHARVVYQAKLFATTWSPIYEICNSISVHLHSNYVHSSPFLPWRNIYNV